MFDLEKKFVDGIERLKKESGIFGSGKWGRNKKNLCIWNLKERSIGTLDIQSCVSISLLQQQSRRLDMNQLL